MLVEINFTFTASRGNDLDELNDSVYKTGHSALSCSEHRFCPHVNSHFFNFMYAQASCSPPVNNVCHSPVVFISHSISCSAVGTKCAGVFPGSCHASHAVAQIVKQIVNLFLFYEIFLQSNCSKACLNCVTEQLWKSLNMSHADMSRWWWEILSAVL